VREGEELMARAMKDKGAGTEGGNGRPARKPAGKKSAAKAAKAPLQAAKPAPRKAAAKSKTRKTRR